MSLLYATAQLADSFIGYRWVTALPLFLFTLAAARQIRRFKTDLVVIGLLLAALPMLTPWATDILGYQYFTMLNYDLQHNSALKVAAVLLITLFCASFHFGASFWKIDSKKNGMPVIKLNLPVTVAMFAIIFFLLTRYLEVDTILYSGYGSIKGEGSPYSSTVNQAFNLFAAVFLSYAAGRQRQRAIVVMYLVVLVLALVVSRRTLAIGVIVLLVYTTGGQRFTLRQILLLFLTITLLWFIGVARSVGIMNYFAEDKAAATFFSLPGGASNLFVGSMGVVDLINSGGLRNVDKMPILGWLSGRMESDIYRSYRYEYNGGMHIANVLYWNFGLIGVVLGGFGLGSLAQRADAVLWRISTGRGGTLGAMLAAGFCISLPNTLWYSPIAVIKLSTGIVAVYAMLRLSQTTQRSHRTDY
jgi:hypothetical protein